MTSSSTRERILEITTAVAALVAVGMYATAPTENGEPPRAEAASLGEAPVGPALTSESYQMAEENDHGESGGDIEALRREIARLRADLATVNARVGQLTRRVQESEQQDPTQGSEISGAMANVDPHTNPTAYAVEWERLEAESEQRILAQAEANEATLQKETEDSTWSGEARDLIINAIAGGGLAGTSVQDVECRATLCRVEVTHKDRQARAVFEQRFMPAVAQLLPQAMPRTVEKEDGSMSSAVYLARDGHDFPQPEATD